MNWYLRDNIFWFRVFGMGISIRNTEKFPLNFSERNGYKRRLKIAKWVINLLPRLP